MGSSPPIRGARPPSQAAYYVALAGVVVLLVLLCCYFLFFCIKRVKELTAQEYGSAAPVAAPRPPAHVSYPVQPVVRDSASAMARLCRQLPAQSGDTVFPEPPAAAGAPASAAGPEAPKTPVITVGTVNETTPVR